MKLSIGRLKVIIAEALDYPGSSTECDEIASIYSDVYKEKYGMSTEEMQAKLNVLYDEPGYVDDYLEEPGPEYPDMEGIVDPSEPGEPFEELGDAPTVIPL